jgi:hypothetical protein
LAKHFLNSGDEDLDFELLGLLCHENQYVLVSAVNRALGINLALNDNIPLKLKAGKIFYFSLYHDTSEEFGLEYFLIPNKSNLDTSSVGNTGSDLFAEMEVEERAALIKELPKTDYFVILKGQDLHLYKHKIMEQIKTAAEIIQVQSIEPRNLPSRMNLVF